MMGATGSSSSEALPSAPSKPPVSSLEDDNIDPDVQELADHFNIEDRWIKRLDEAMRKRKDTKEQDLAKLYEVLERARSPTGLLTVKIGEMESGRFVGKVKPDKDVERLGRKFKLDEYVVSRLTELAVRRKETKENDLDRIEQHLRYCKRPNALATLLAGKLLEHTVDELPDLKAAEEVMMKFKLDEDARSKLREIVEHRAEDQKEVLAQIDKQLETSPNPSSVLCKIARDLIDGKKLADPPDRPRYNKGSDRDEKGSGKGGGGGSWRDNRDGGGGGGSWRDSRDDGGGDRDRRGDRGGGDRDREWKSQSWSDRDRRDGDRDRRHRSRSRDRGGDRGHW